MTCDFFLKATLCALLFTLGGCAWLDDMGRHMPVVGERCENWQCFTKSGQEQSRIKKQMREHGVQTGQPYPSTQMPDTAEGSTTTPVPGSEAAVPPERK